MLNVKRLATLSICCTLAACSGSSQSPSQTKSPEAPAADPPAVKQVPPSTETQPPAPTAEPQPEPQPSPAAPTVESAPAAPPPPSCPGKSETPGTNGNAITVAAGGDLQAAIDGAQPGDEIVLAAGASFSPVHLPEKGGASFITVRTSAIDKLPPAGTRVTPANAAAMARIAGDSAVRTDPGAHHYRFVGIEMTGGPESVVTLGSSSETNLSRVPHDLIFDRVYVHGDAARGVHRAVQLNSAATTIINSWISDAKSSTQEAQAIAGWNGPGPFTILNNHIEGSTQNLFFGGADPAIADLVPSDIVIKWNHFYKPLSWKPDDPSYAGTHWWVKNILELKSARRVTIDGNLFENCWQSEQSGEVALFTVRNQDGHAPWATVENVRFTNNVARHTGGGISILGHDDNHPSQAAHDFVIANNLFYDLGGSVWRGWGRFLVLNSGTSAPGPSGVKVDHNTVMQTGDVLVSATPQTVVNHPGLSFTNNLTMNGPRGVVGDGTTAGDSSFASYFSDAIFIGNALIQGAADAYAAHPGNHFPASTSDAGLPDPATGRLTSGSPLLGAATDKKDIGVDAAALEAAAACRTD